MSTQEIRKNRTLIKISYNFPVVVVTRSNANISAQVIDPNTRLVIFTANSNKLDKAIKSDKSSKVGVEIANFLKKAGFTKATFNRNGYLYHGRILQLAESIRGAGIEI
jgi:large subunit ribosomal protein L18